MCLANPDLWKGHAGAYAVVHLLAHRRILARVIFSERGFLAIQKRFGRTAITAAWPCIDFDFSSHLALKLTNKSEDYMGALGLSTTRAKTSTSTCTALARSRARAQASAVAPEVRTSSIKITRRPAISGCRSAGTLKAPCTLLARCGRDSPTCCSVGRTRCNSSPRSFTPLACSITRASAPD